jgi:hypothetical protein
MARARGQGTLRAAATREYPRHLQPRRTNDLTVGGFELQPKGQSAFASQGPRPHGEMIGLPRLYAHPAKTFIGEPVRIVVKMGDPDKNADYWHFRLTD